MCVCVCVCVCVCACARARARACMGARMLARTKHLVSTHTHVHAINKSPISCSLQDVPFFPSISIPDDGDINDIALGDEVQGAAGGRKLQQSENDAQRISFKGASL